MIYNTNNFNTEELLDKYLYSNCIIVDIRNPMEYANYHIPNSINIPYDYIIQKPYCYLNKAITYYIICNTGVKSSRLCLQLIKQNYSLINVLGGIAAWSGPLEKL